MFIKEMAKEYGLLAENVILKYDKISYAILPYSEWLGGTDPRHGPRLKIAPKDKMSSKNNFMSFAIDSKTHGVTIDNTHGNRNKLYSNSEVAEMRNIIAALAQYDYDTIADYKENTKSSDKMQDMCDDFASLPKEKQKEYIKKGKEATRNTK